MMQTDHYTYRVHWSAEDNEYVATVAELPSLSWLADTPAAAIEGLLALTAEVVSETEAAGETHQNLLRRAISSSASPRKHTAA